MSKWPDGYGLKHYPELDSTNAEALRLSAAGEKGPLWITADRQTAGRGRRGRAWESLSGNLAATLLLTPARPLAEWPQLSFAAAIATAETAARLAPRARIALKWPNDVLAAPRRVPRQEYRKLAGILLERAEPHGSEERGLAIGIGVNLAHFPPDTEFPATSLAALGAKVPSTGNVLTALAAHFAIWYEGWIKNGFTDLGIAWLERAHGRNKTMTARLPSETLRGTFMGIDSNGALALWDGKKTHLISAGDIFFG